MLRLMKNKLKDLICTHWGAQENLSADWFQNTEGLNSFSFKKIHFGEGIVTSNYFT